MGSMSPIHWLILAVVLLVVFGGGGKISGMMGDFAKGIKSFKKNMADDETMTPPSEAGQVPPGHISPPNQPSGYSQTTNSDTHRSQV
ncbi:twin-arginine translocase TatA/TatE family subunit [Gluconobacter wancherniae]|uniref:Sec-independent protein translocase protein TatA n=1 Tax=Gluconobacter wancherniae NBRC 103581 TaxID=656744 RepID=A0A511B011_9PROT|nr:twin-arginine translocase TatA/TatE family subunit [Gluconobacter wancherniae]MBF0854389.1 twin-arginine translocase TatA/TatE family subunit [Gluconobacter wancherniae]MBS1062785.1 twin-arginine translocase TatA/TatE family subunit [Gluconobacter wancherniae]MBS1088479.1 twin-arginine translocase TatA/TatE family subunit [Gluconobacter wancherniae]MBS1094919.1 twin-arginine translocase TatA/TatE family subunit [Gluconobacter wancherniae]GBD57450.1 Sec-independent protein translocase protei